MVRPSLAAFGRSWIFGSSYSETARIKAHWDWAYPHDGAQMKIESTKTARGRNFTMRSMAEKLILILPLDGLCRMGKVRQSPPQSVNDGPAARHTMDPSKRPLAPDPGRSLTVEVEWRLGNFCSFSCGYCPDVWRSGSAPWQDQNSIKTTLMQIAQHYQAGLDMRVSVRFTGGEPTSHPRLPDILHLSKSLGFQTSIESNASRAYDFWKRILPDLDAATLSFHQKSDIAQFSEVAALLSEKLPVQLRLPTPSGKVNYALEKARLLAKLVPKANVSVMVLREEDLLSARFYTAQERRLLKRPVHVPNPSNIAPFDDPSASAPIWTNAACNAGIERICVTVEGENPSRKLRHARGGWHDR